MPTGWAMVAEILKTAFLVPLETCSSQSHMIHWHISYVRACSSFCSGAPIFTPAPASPGYSGLLPELISWTATASPSRHFTLVPSTSIFRYTLPHKTVLCSSSPNQPLLDFVSQTRSPLPPFLLCSVALLSHVGLSVAPGTVCSLPGSSVHGSLQARRLHRAGCHFLPLGIFRTQDWIHASCISCIGKWVLYLGGSAVKESTCNVGDLSSICRLERCPGEGNGYPVQYSDLENSMDRGREDWQATVHGAKERWTRLSDFHFLYRKCQLVSPLFTASA